MTQIVNEKLKKMCNKCQSNLDKPCAWLSLGNEYCTEIMETQKAIDQLTNNWNELEEWVKEMSMGTCEYNSYDEVRDKMKELKDGNK